MNKDIENVKINILDREYNIKCETQNKIFLQSAAVSLDKKMREIRASGKVTDVGRIAIIAALNFANDYLIATRENKKIQQELNNQIEILMQNIDKAIKDNKECCELSN